MAYSFNIIKEPDWSIVEQSADSTVFHSYAWNLYLKHCHLHPIIIKIFKDGEICGHFIGSSTGLGRFKIIGAPFKGFGTYTQGLCLFNDVDRETRILIYYELAKYIFENNIALFIKIDDWNLRYESVEYLNPKEMADLYLDTRSINYLFRPTLFLDLKKSEEELWKQLHYKSAKYCINKAKKLGLKIKLINKFEDIPEFVKIHYDQLVDVCKRHGTHPKMSQSKKRMINVCESCFPNRVLMIEVIGTDEQQRSQVMSSGIFCYDKGESTYWTGASYQQFQKYCPNELMVWEAIKILQNKGAGPLNFCGIANYKLKFGTKYAYVPQLIFTKYRCLTSIRELITKLYQKIKFSK